MVVPVGIRIQYLKLLEKIKGEIKIVDIIPVRFVRLTGKGVSQK